ncbi:MAG: beta-N-acetylhexosaminidase [Fermentimonas sp.]|jgi:hexosaminidase
MIQISYNKVFFVFLFLVSSIVISCSDIEKDDKDDSKAVLSHNSVNMIIPKPVLIRSGSNNFHLTPKVKIIGDESHKEITSISNYLSKMIENIVGFPLKSTHSVRIEKNTIYLELLAEQNDSIGDEGYILEVKPSTVHISANKPAGIFYGVQTLIQLLPETFEKSNINKNKCEIPCIYVEDYPRFRWRGLLFDAAHWWYEKEDIMKYIDQMAKYKYNTLTLHLTNDNAWRIEIKSFPKLNEIGSWRVPRTGIWGTFEDPLPGEKATYGGFYKQEELKELVKYAQERYVTIVPKIELPGHMLALIASYPETSCTGLQYHVNPGARRKYGEIPYEMCAGKESNFEMLDKILDEYVEIFPSEYIHIGGDEVNYSFWKTCPKCKQRMKDENLQNVEELQSYFIKRVSNMLSNKGRKLIGWDEILKGGLAPNATVMSWRGMEGGIQAAQMKHDVVMAPNTYTYFDYRQTDRNVIPETYCWGFLNLSKTYSWEPVPDNVDPQYIIGGQGQLWSEFMPHLRQIEYMTWPRALALAEVLWTPRNKREIDDFLLRTETHFSRFELDNVKYATSVYDPIITPIKNEAGQMQLTFSTEFKDLDIFYSFDGTIPDNFSEKFQEGHPVNIPPGVTHVWAVTYRNNQPIGKWLSISIDELNKRL